jgi:predicted HAD superfamily phosphohydrolase YqeG
VIRTPNLIRPNIRINRVTELTQEHLKGVKSIIFDKDDTLTLHG